MKHSANGLYVEEYLKCLNCGELIYDEGLYFTNEDGVEIGPFSTVWDIEWYQGREAREKATGPQVIKEWRSEMQQ